MSTAGRHSSQGHRVPFFDFHEANGRWSIHDTRTGAPAVINGKPQTGLSLSEADDLTAVLNRVELQQAAMRQARGE
jgi:hypothetical protein